MPACRSGRSSGRRLRRACAPGSAPSHGDPGHQPDDPSTPAHGSSSMSHAMSFYGGSWFSPVSSSATRNITLPPFIVNIPAPHGELIVGGYITVNGDLIEFKKDPQNSELDKKVGKESLILNKTIERVKNRLTGDCLKLLGGIDALNYLANYLSIGNQTYGGTAFPPGKELLLASTQPTYGGNGRRLAGGHTVFNQNSAFFTGMYQGQAYVPPPGSSVSGLSLDQIRELAVIHELFHVYDAMGLFDDDTGDPNADAYFSRQINLMIRKDCGFPNR